MRSRLWVALHCVLLALPATAALLHVPDSALAGVEPPSDAPAWTLHAWSTEHLQKALTSAFEAHLGFRGVLVRTDNTLLHASLGESKPDAVVKVGRRGTLFIDDDLYYASKRPQDLTPPVVMDHLADLAGRLQRRLEAGGKRLVVIVSPSKTDLYPEDVPRAWRRPSGVPRSDVVAHAALARALRSHGVTFTDAGVLLSESPDRAAVFARTARHWSAVGACRALRESAPDLVPNGCSFSWRYVDPGDPGQPDFDLFRLLDTWHPFYAVAPVAVLDRHPPVKEPLRVLFVGTSFTWMLIDAVRLDVREAECFYYNRTIYDATGPLPRPIGPVDPSSPSWATHALEKDVYVLELFEGYVDGAYARDFLETMLARVP